MYKTLHLNIPCGPVSRQAKKAHRERFQDEVKRQTISFPFILTGELQVRITWLVSERKRYESDSSPDVDNTLKPMIDALTGPNGVMIDDCQIQSICCTWIDINDNESIEIEIEYSEYELVNRGKLELLAVGKELCLPIDSSWPYSLIESLLERYNSRLPADYSLVETREHYVARMTMPLITLFHRSRIHQRKVITIQEMKNRLAAQDSTA